MQENEGTPTKEAKRTTEIVVGLKGVWRGCPATMPEGVDAPSPPGALELAEGPTLRMGGHPAPSRCSANTLKEVNRTRLCEEDERLGETLS